MLEQYSILIVDDDAEIVNILQTALQDAGYQTHTACNGEEACRLAEALRPQLVVMDVMMPRCSGLGLAIAQTYAEALGGRFEIVIDGDQFNAVVTLPRL